MAKRKPRARKPSSPETLFVGPIQPPPPHEPLPAWWSPPDASISARDRGDRKYGPRAHVVSACDVIEDMEAGHYALPMWQRGDVWSHAQRVAMLDSMMRGLPMPPLILWKPDVKVKIEFMPFDGCPTKRPWLVVDGRQRLTTLLMAATGALDVRWDGYAWTSGKGYIDTPTALRGRAMYLALNAFGHGYGDDVAMPIVHTHDRMYFYRFSVIEFDGYSPAEMVEAYRRMAVCGTSHSEDDLQAMETWFRLHGGK
jgi:hypothetical protein